MLSQKTDGLAHLLPNFGESVVRILIAITLNDLVYNFLSVFEVKVFLLKYLHFSRPSSRHTLNYHFNMILLFLSFNDS